MRDETGQCQLALGKFGLAVRKRRALATELEARARPFALHFFERLQRGLGANTCGVGALDGGSRGGGRRR